MRSRSGQWLDIALTVLGVVLGTMWWMMTVIVRVLLLVGAGVVVFVIGLRIFHRR